MHSSAVGKIAATNSPQKKKTHVGYVDSEKLIQMNPAWSDQMSDPKGQSIAITPLNLIDLICS